MTATEALPEAPFVGSRMVRREDAPLLTGEAKYTADLPIPGALHLAVLRSPFAHARIRSIDTSAAAVMDGVVAVYTGEDLQELWANPMPSAWAVTEDMKNPPHYPLAVGTVNYVGDGVAAVLAHSDAQARDALEAIVVDYDPLPAVVDLEDALSDRVLVHEELGTNSAYTWELKIGEEALEAAFASAAFTVKERFVQQRLIAMAMEPRACAAVPQPFGGDMTLYSATQIPHILKVMASITLGTPEQQLRVVAPSVGGGFGSKLEVYAEELLCLALAGQAPGAGPLGGGAHRGRPGHRAGSRPDPGDRTGRRQRRQAHRHPGEPHRRHGRLPDAHHRRGAAAGSLPVRRGLRPARGVLVHAAPACTPP